MLLALLLAADAAAAQPPARQPVEPRDARAAPSATTAAPTPAHAPMPAQHPDAALLEYLGEFDGAADGLDAMGLEESTQGNGKGDDGKTKGRQTMRIER